MLHVVNNKVEKIESHLKALEQRDLPIPLAACVLNYEIDGLIAGLNSMKSQIVEFLPSPERATSAPGLPVNSQFTFVATEPLREKFPLASARTNGQMNQDDNFSFAMGASPETGK